MFASLKGFRFSRGLNLAVHQVSFMHNIFANAWPRGFETWQKESRNLSIKIEELLSNTQPLSERERSLKKLVLWYARADGHKLAYILLRNSTQPTLQPIEVLSAIRLNLWWSNWDE